MSIKTMNSKPPEVPIPGIAGHAHYFPTNITMKSHFCIFRMDKNQRDKKPIKKERKDDET
jgi:hypothetical protein